MKKIQTRSPRNQEMARQAGDISHIVYLNPQDQHEFLGIDTWQSAEQGAGFRGQRPNTRVLRSAFFDGQPEVTGLVRIGFGTSGDSLIST